MIGERATDRVVFSITGGDRVKFLQGLVSNDVEHLTDHLVYAAMLTPQGKYLADFFLTESSDAILLDVKDSFSKALFQRLSMYKLRANVDIKYSDLKVLRGVGEAPSGALSDPRHPALGWRAISEDRGARAAIDWDAIRVEHCVPETGIELIPNEQFILEAGFERLSGVDFQKGCYVGQEVTARMKHKTELRKGFVTVEIDGQAPVGTDILARGKVAGQIFTQSGGRAIAYLRFGRADAEMTAGDARVSWKK
ncbi:MAG: CAF17-like 4Fe-4S cluster assembly/insertion protein YgfZ [Paracoccaceae bacterium]